MERKRAVNKPLCALLAFFFAVTFAPVSKAALGSSASGACLIELSTKKVLYASSAHTKLPMASTTKVMTALLAIEHGNLDDLVKTPNEAYAVEGSSIYLEQGEELSLRDLVYGLMLSSGNDAAVSIAVHIGGSVEGFAELMNAKARELGAMNTHFVTPNGLNDENHYTTAYDLSLICACAMENSIFRTVVATQYHRTATGNVQRTFKNKNKLLWQYEGGAGIKTGYTKAAGKCLAFAAERSGMTLIGVVLACPDMLNEAKAMLDYGFENYSMQRIMSAGTPVTTISVDEGAQKRLQLSVNSDVSVPVKRGELMTLKARVVVDKAHAPIIEGERLGYVELYEDGRIVRQIPLIAAKGVDLELKFDYYLLRALKIWLEPFAAPS